MGSDDLLRRRARQLAAEAAAAGDPAGWAFDVSPTAVAEAAQRFAGSPVKYQVADLLAPPPEWTGAFDLVVEIYTVQALYGEARVAAIGKPAHRALSREVPRRRKPAQTPLASRVQLTVAWAACQAPT